MNSVRERTLVLRTSCPTVDRRVYPSRVMRIVGDRDAVLRVREGIVWLTFDKSRVTRPGGWDDYFLKPGQGIVLYKGDEVVLSAGGPRYGTALFDMEPIGAVAPPRPGIVARVLDGIAGLIPTPAGLAHA
jgi:hypothetical protein